MLSGQLTLDAGTGSRPRTLANKPRLTTAARFLARDQITVNFLNGLLAGDEIKPTPSWRSAQLQQRSIRVAMLSGDNHSSANAVGRQLGITEVHAEILPGEKARVITDLKSGAAVVAMVGDGIAAPAGCRDVGIAMSTGTDVAMRAAGITRCAASGSVADAIDISRALTARFARTCLGFYLQPIGIRWRPGAI